MSRRTPGYVLIDMRGTDFTTIDGTGHVAFRVPVAEGQDIREALCALLAERLRPTPRSASLADVAARAEQARGKPAR